MRQAAVDYMPC